MACSRLLPHISSEGCSEPQTAGRSGRPNKVQRKSASRQGQGIPAGLPLGRPGSGDEMDGAVQQAAQPDRQFMSTIVHGPLGSPCLCGGILGCAVWRGHP